MIARPHERRKHRHFRLLYMDLGNFMKRFFGRESRAAAPVPIPQAKSPALNQGERPGAPPSLHPPGAPHLVNGQDRPGPPEAGVTPRAGIRHLDAALVPPFLSGIDRIDQQHTALLATLHELSATLRTPGGEEGLPRIMASLDSYVEEHFSIEEAYMRHMEFPALAEHLKEHAYFRSQVHQLGQRVAVGDTTVVLELSSLLFTWFKNHLLQEDLLYVEHARRKNKG